MLMDAQLHFSPEVRQALEDKKAVVALESTLITHGLPYPENVETALAMEAAVREAGAVPATIAVLNGKITVGLGEADVERLGQAEDVRKCSRRDLPLAVGLGEDGATTVAGTMVVAHMAGIRVFATGGVGGVHRGHPFDVSADLVELGRTPVTVVSSGLKSILDLPLTLETLETQGVPVVGYGVDTLPAFYNRESGLPIDARVDTPQQVAQIIMAAVALGVQNGMLVTVPVPEEAALDAEEAEQAIQQAVAAADDHGISGKDLTPFILAEVKRLTEGRSLRANRALLINNARTGGEISLALAEHQRETAAT